MNIKKYIKKHDDFMKKSLPMADYDIDWLLKYHESKLCFLQQERKVHLFVTVAFSFFLMLIFLLAIFDSNFYYYLIFLILSILLLFYFFHYYTLENSVQRWYIIHQKLMRVKNKNATRK